MIKGDQNKYTVVTDAGVWTSITTTKKYTTQQRTHNIAFMDRTSFYNLLYFFLLLFCWMTEFHCKHVFSKDRDAHECHQMTERWLACSPLSVTIFKTPSDLWRRFSSSWQVFSASMSLSISTTIFNFLYPSSGTHLTSGDTSTTTS